MQYAFNHQQPQRPSGTSIALSPDGKFVAAGNRSGHFGIVNVNSQASIYSPQCDSAVRASYLCVRPTFSHDRYRQNIVSLGRRTGKLPSLYLRVATLSKYY